MALEFEIGNPQKPRGHALVYFRDSMDSEKLYATYVVVFPLPVNIAKYVPPFLANSLGSASVAEISSFPMPPVPEDVESYERILQLAEARGDDLIYGGVHSPRDVAGGMQAVGEIAHEYSEIWSKFDESQRVPALEEPAEEGLSVSEVMYSLLGEKDRLNELSKLVVKFRYAVEGRDREMREEVSNELHILARFLPERYHVGKLIDAAEDSSSRGTRLAQLYLERCYGLSDEDAAKVEGLEREIRAMESSD
jgi:hypothetical protein